MPASRRARAITFAPRSWPSSPGLATSTRIGCCILQVCRLLVHAEDIAQRVADFTQGGVGPYGIEQERHRVVGPLGGAAESVERRLHAAIIAPCPQRRQFFLLPARGGLVDLQHFD